MLVLLIFTFISGLVTILAPCIWPLLPVILSSTTGGGHKKPLGITLGITTGFTLFTLTISYLVRAFPIDADSIRLLAVFVIGFLGLTLIFPKLSAILESYVSRLTGRFSGITANSGTGFWSGYITGFALGLVWSPCAGPILAAIATLAATQAVNFQVVLVTLVYVAGVGIPLFFFAYAGQKFLVGSRSLNKYTGKIQQAFGVIMILTAFAIYTGYDRTLQAKLLDSFPSYTNFIYDLESGEQIDAQLDNLLNRSDTKIMDGDNKSKLRDLGKAPDFVGIENWLNSEPLTMAELEGKVVLIDFWTYTCINCIRTLPHVTGWYEKYKDDNFVVVGVHTPEFEFEKKTENVQKAIEQYNINYPVAQDNNFKTWKNYANRYWPAKYLIDANGRVRYTHFGEGAYDETEMAIQGLLKEAGMEAELELSNIDDQTPTSRSRTPETYLGDWRMANFSSPQGYGEGTKDFTAPESLTTHYWAFEGKWTIGYQESVAEENAKLKMKFDAKDVFLVMTPSSDENATNEVVVKLDGEVVDTVKLDESRLYDIVKLAEQGVHNLELEFSPGISIFAFTFG